MLAMLAMPAMLAMLAMPLAAAMLGTLSSKWTTQSYHIRGPFIPNTAIPYYTVPYKGSLRHSSMTKSHPSYTPSLVWNKHWLQKAIDDTYDNVRKNMCLSHSWSIICFLGRVA